MNIRRIGRHLLEYRWRVRTVVDLENDGAAVAVLELGSKLRESVELSERVSRIEAALCGRPTLREATR